MTTRPTRKSKANAEVPLTALEVETELRQLLRSSYALKVVAQIHRQQARATSTRLQRQVVALALNGWMPPEGLTRPQLANLAHRRLREAASYYRPFRGGR